MTGRTWLRTNPRLAARRHGGLTGSLFRRGPRLLLRAASRAARGRSSPQARIAIEARCRAPAGVPAFAGRCRGRAGASAVAQRRSGGAGAMVHAGAGRTGAAGVRQRPRNRHTRRLPFQRLGEPGERSSAPERPHDSLAEPEPRSGRGCARSPAARAISRWFEQRVLDLGEPPAPAAPRRSLMRRGSPSPRSRAGLTRRTEPHRGGILLVLEAGRLGTSAPPGIVRDGGPLALSPRSACVRWRMVMEKRTSCLRRRRRRRCRAAVGAHRQQPALRQRGPGPPSHAGSGRRRGRCWRGPRAAAPSAPHPSRPPPEQRVIAAAPMPGAFLAAEVSDRRRRTAPSGAPGRGAPG